MRRNYLTTIILSSGVESILDIRQLLQNNGFVNGLSPLIRRYKFSNAFVLRHPAFYYLFLINTKMRFSTNRKTHCGRQQSIRTTDFRANILSSR